MIKAAKLLIPVMAIIASAQALAAPDLTEDQRAGYCTAVVEQIQLRAHGGAINDPTVITVARDHLERLAVYKNRPDFREAYSKAHAHLTKPGNYVPDSLLQSMGADCSRRGF